MIPFLLAIAGGYLIGHNQSITKFSNGGSVEDKAKEDFGELWDLLTNDEKKEYIQIYENQKKRLARTNLKDVYYELSQKIVGLRINEDKEDFISCDVRDWGIWEHDYEDYERDEDDFEDDDFMILSDNSAKRMSEIVNSVRNKYPDVIIQWSTSEKNYIDFQITRK